MAFVLIGSNAQAGGGCGGGSGGLKSMSKFRQPKFKKYLDYKMVSFSEEGINNKKEFSKISKCHKIVFGSKNKVKALDALSLEKCKNMMKGDLEFQANYIKQPNQNIVKSSILETKSDDQNKLEKRRNSAKVSNNSSISSNNTDELLFFD
tara:strand:- start:485 stop:934 length:450 start_codon:yes stop_codon:yes gene_type:complete